MITSWLYLLFFFQAEDGIRDLTVTGVQTCALPISPDRSGAVLHNDHGALRPDRAESGPGSGADCRSLDRSVAQRPHPWQMPCSAGLVRLECRSGAEPVGTAQRIGGR